MSPSKKPRPSAPSAPSPSPTPSAPAAKASRRTRQTVLAELSLAGRKMSGATINYHATLSARLGLSPTEEKALDVLEREGAITAGRLRELSGLAAASVTGLIDRLERKGFVRRVADPADGRRVLVALDPEAMTRMGPLFADWFRSLAELYERYTIAELEVILDFMSRVSERQNAATQRLVETTPEP